MNAQPSLPSDDEDLNKNLLKLVNCGHKCHGYVQSTHNVSRTTKYPASSHAFPPIPHTNLERLRWGNNGKDPHHLQNT